MQTVQPAGMGVPAQPGMSGYGAPAGANIITTELIQKYLDENKQLILAILDNQNLGKLNECAQYQQRLQQNLMYLAAIADAQPQLPPPSQQAVPSPAMQPQGPQYVQQPQQTQGQPQPVMQQAPMVQGQPQMQQPVAMQQPMAQQQAPPAMMVQQQVQQQPVQYTQQYQGMPQQVVVQQQPMGLQQGGHQMQQQQPMGHQGHVIQPGMEGVDPNGQAMTGQEYGTGQGHQIEAQPHQGMDGAYLQQDQQQAYEMQQQQQQQQVQQGMVPQQMGHGAVMGVEGVDPNALQQGMGQPQEGDGGLQS